MGDVAGIDDNYCHTLMGRPAAGNASGRRWSEWCRCVLLLQYASPRTLGRRWGPTEWPIRDMFSHFYFFSALACIPENNIKCWRSNLTLQTWTDLKFRTRQKASAVGTAMWATGNPDRPGEMTDTEKKMLAVIGGDSALGHPEVAESMGQPAVEH